MFNSIKLWIGVGTALALFSLMLTIYSLSSKNAKLKAELISVNSQLTNAQTDIKTQELSAKFGNWVNENYLKNNQEIQNENDNLRRDVATGKRQLHPNATCVQSNVTSTGNTSSTIGTTARFDPAAEQGLLDLREGIPINAEQYKLAIVTLKYWHDNWYALCGAKEK